MQQATSLGISIGTRSVGLAVMRGNRLLDWRVKSFTTAMTEQKLHMITGAILQVVKEFNVSSVVLKEPLALEMYDNLAVLKRQLLKKLASCSIQVSCYSISVIKASIGVGISNKKQIAECIVSLYPELRFVYMKEQQSKNNYYQKLFEAVAALHCSIHKR